MKYPLSKLDRKSRERTIPRTHIKIDDDGMFEIIGLNTWYSYWRDPYHLMLTIPWSFFVLLLCSIYLGINLLFALLYWMGGDCIANAKPGSFLDIFFFSVQTLASIGYGLMYPKSTYSNIIVTIEAIVGVMGVAVMTGLAFARFSQPTARLLFSRVVTVSPYNGVLTLMFRTANQRRNAILEAQVKVYLMRDELTLEGNMMRRLYDLKLVRNQTPSFALSWSVMHVIDESSPLYGATGEVLRQNASLLMVSLSGTDETVTQRVHSRHLYSYSQILWNTRFVNIIHQTHDGHRYIDYKHFHDVVPVDEAVTSHMGIT